MILLFYIFAGLPSTPSFLQSVIVVDHFTSFFRILFLLIGIGILFISAEFVENHLDKKGEYYALILTAVLATMLMAAANELLTAFLAIELLSFSLYVLVSITRSDHRSNEAGIKYIILGVLSSALFLFGISYVYGILGTTVFHDISQATISAPVNLGLLFGITLIIVGFGFKVAAVPFHMWAPDVYEGAPLPTTALLATLAKAAVFALFIRVFITAFGPSISSWQTIILILAGLTMTLGNLVALTQSNIKRLMAYSSIGQSGYMLMGIAAFSHLTISGLIFHISGYALSTLAAFFAIIVYYNQTGH
jgi:NADH-quinone oxidoreductase subunit N